MRPPEQIESRFLELRAKLEDKIAKAPTPGLKEKYRETLAEITTAFETLALAADSSALPVLRRDAPQEARGERLEARGNTAPSSEAPTSRASRPTPQAAPSRRSGGKEFALVAVVAVLVLVGGGWWVMKTRAENLERQGRVPCYDEEFRFNEGRPPRHEWRLEGHAGRGRYPMLRVPMLASRAVVSSHDTAAAALAELCPTARVQFVPPAAPAHDGPAGSRSGAFGHQDTRDISVASTWGAADGGFVEHRSHALRGP